MSGKDSEMLLMISDIHERTIRIETKMESLPALQAQVHIHAEEILKAKTTLRIIKWAGGVILAVVATVSAALKAFH